MEQKLKQLQQLGLMISLQMHKGVLDFIREIKKAGGSGAIVAEQVFEKTKAKFTMYDFFQFP